MATLSEERGAFQLTDHRIFASANNGDYPISQWIVKDTQAMTRTVVRQQPRVRLLEFSVFPVLK
jgi:hypothetical protein